MLSQDDLAAFLWLIANGFLSVSAASDFAKDNNIERYIAAITRLCASM